MSRLCSLVAPVFGCPSFVYFRGRLVTSLLSFYRLCYRYGGLGSSLLRIRHVFFWRVCPSLFLGCCRYFSAEPSLVDSRPWFWRFLVQVPCCLRVFDKVQHSALFRSLLTGERLTAASTSDWSILGSTLRGEHPQWQAHYLSDIVMFRPSSLGHG